MTLSDSPMVACIQCDLLIKHIRLKAYEVSHCPRCGHLLREGRSHSVLNALVLSLTGLLLFIPAIGLPIMGLTVFGVREDVSLMQSVLGLSRAGFWPVGALVFTSAIAAPFFNLWLLFSVSLALSLKHAPRRLSWLLRFNHVVRRWSMIEVFFLGILVTIIKLKELATLLPGWGLLCVLCLMLVLLLLNSVIDEYDFWESMDQHEAT